MCVFFLCVWGLGVEDVVTDCKISKVVVKGEKADPLKVLERVQRKSHRQVELISPIPKPKTEEEKKSEEAEKPKPEEKKEEVKKKKKNLFVFPKTSRWFFFFNLNFFNNNLFLVGDSFLCCCLAASDYHSGAKGSHAL